MPDDPQFSITRIPDPRFPEITPVIAVGQYVLPTHFLARAEIGALAVELEVTLDEAAKPTCRGLTVRPVIEGDALGSGVLRSVPIKRLLTDATAAAAEMTVPSPDQSYIRERGTGKVHPHFEPDAEPDTVRPATAAERRAFYERIAGGRGPGRGSPVTDDHLARVATVYRAALEQGDPPTQSVADAMHCARSTAGRWVVEARKRDFLGPAAKGRAGEAKS